jgi:hypothetical protein
VTWDDVMLAATHADGPTRKMADALLAARPVIEAVLVMNGKFTTLRNMRDKLDDVRQASYAYAADPRRVTR